MNHVLRCSLILMALLTGSCAKNSIADPTGDTPTVVRKVTDYTFRKVVGSQMTLQFRTISFSDGGDTTTVVGSAYRYTVVDTGFMRTDGRRCLAIQRETITDGDVRFVDTTHQYTDGSQLITFERMTDTVDRRRLVEPVRVGTWFLYRDTFGNVESNRYSIVGVDVPIKTPLGTYQAVHVRMATQTPDSTGTRTFLDEQWLVPGMHIVLQRQTSQFVPINGGATSTSISEFFVVERSW
ncbi:MAG: hypothetical protein FGM24_02420 [Candidatus Kapabacteria bacterium]|nr:hypothetical protein [Candidatus Kapabacteria bacterium]